jgi:ribonuclease Z
MIFEDKKFSVKAAAIKHRIPCFGFVIQENDQVGSLDVEKLKTLGLNPGPHYADLKSGKSVLTPSGVEVKPEDVTGEAKKGRKVVILGDTCDTREIAPLCNNADLVVHEATMEESLREKAIEFGHSTPTMAAEFAFNVKAKLLCLTHVSPRYKPVSEVKDSNKDSKDYSAQVLLNEAEAFLVLKSSTTTKVTIVEDFQEEEIFSSTK